MTRLEAKRRKQNFVHKFGNNAMKQTGKKLSKGFVSAGNLFLSSKSKPEIDSITERAMRVEVEDLLHDHNGACALLQIANTLANSNRVRNAYASSSTGKQQQQQRRFRDLFTFNKNKQESMVRRYELTNVLKKMESQHKASTTMIDSWAKARESLAGNLSFSTPNIVEDEQQEGILVPYDFQTVRKTIEALGVRKKIDNFDNELIPSEEKWKQIVGFKVPERLGDRKEEEKDLLSKTVESEYVERRESRESQIIKDLEQRALEKEKEDEAKAMASSLLRDYTDEEEDIIQEAVWGDGPLDEVLQSEGTDTVQRASMHKLRDGQWLNDEVIHFFYVMLSKRDEELCKADPNKKRSHFFKSFFMTKLLNEGHTDPSKDGVFDYSQVKRWSKKVPGKDIFNLDKVFFPINVARMHWVCAVAFIQEKRIQFYDSFGSPGIDYLEHIFNYLKKEHEAKKGSPLPDMDQWKLVPCTPDTPSQGNGYDCGVFTCGFADFLSLDYPLLFTQEHVSKWRKRIALSIMLGKAIQ